ncbi:MAG: ABC transporter permease [Alphaproteobacteria bacterium]|nr:ABC transporter permease [Alphaproteobacteria bacterium]
MKLIFAIAFTHVRHRLRQTLVAVLGVMTGVGFSIVMASLMEGTQNDFIGTLVDALPHIAITDESREPTLQPAVIRYPVVEMHGLTPQIRRPGIKNPLATIAALEAWDPGPMTLSVQSKAVLRFAGRDLNVAIVGINPRTEGNVSTLPKQIRSGSMSALYRASNAVLLGDRLITKIGARINSKITLISAKGVTISATVVGTFHSGFRATDEGTGYVLLRTAQTLENQIGVINEIRIRTRDPMEARAISNRIGEQTGYKSVSWQEAQEDLLSAVKKQKVILYAVVGAMLLVGSFGTYNIISTITHEKTRDIAIMKSLGFNNSSVMLIFIVEALLIGIVGAVVGWAFGYLLCISVGSIRIDDPLTDNHSLPLAYSAWHYAMATMVALAASLIAGFFPARSAARLLPVDILRGAT